MNKLRVYIDTSIVGGLFDEEFESYSNVLFDAFKENHYTPVVSNVTLLELDNAPTHVKETLSDLNNIEVIDTTEEMENLAELYINAEVVTRKFSDDALHIAIASITKADVLVSWNFKHIVNLHRIHKFNSINIREGYSMLEIRSPREVIDDEN